ncbi:MAG: hypothetical protein JO304_18070 [Solirubrobacterales bacterium]|nr:hypothetical protein [Solirubrobacterales bacterium]
MSTLQNTTQHRDRIRTRIGTGALALAALIAIGLALLILMPIGHRTGQPTALSIAQPHSQAAALIAHTAHPGGWLHDPATHALISSQAAPAPSATPAPAGYYREPATHRLLRLPAARHLAGQHPTNHFRGRIIP